MTADVPALSVTPFHRRMLTAIVMISTVMQVLDSTIANVALPHMQGALGATPESINWVLTSYIVAAAIATPVTGWLTDRIGRRALLFAAVTVFTAASVMCALAWSLPVMVVARLVQGLFGAFILPLGQALMFDINPRSRHAQAMTLWGMVVMVAPVLGPVLGGWLTDSFDWRWVFLINLPIGFVAIAGIVVFMPRAPHAASRFDAFGFALLFLAIGGFQLFLDRGQQNDWFDSPETIAEAAVAIGAAWAFVVHTLTARAPLLPTALFRDRNLTLAVVFVLIIMGLVIASSAMLPPLLQRLMGHDAYSAGLITAPRGIGMAGSMLLAGRLARRVDTRMLILSGLALTAISVRMMMGFSLEMGSGPVVVSGLVQGFGFGLVVLPLNLAAFATLDARWRTQGASLYALSRSIGGSAAIALMSALLARQTQVSHADLAAHITDGTIPFFAAGQFDTVTPTVMGFAEAEIGRQAAMIAYLDAFTAMFWLIIAAAPLVLLMRSPRAAGADAAAHAVAME